MSPKSCAYEIEPKSPFFSAVCSITEYELRQPGNTVTFLSEVDLTEVERLRGLAAQGGLRKPSYTAFVIKSVAMALRDFPYANRRIARTWFGLRTRVQKFC